MASHTEQSSAGSGAWSSGSWVGVHAPISVAVQKLFPKAFAPAYAAGAALVFGPLLLQLITG